MKVVTNYNFSGNQIQNAALHPLAAAPSNPVVGQVYTNTNTGTSYVWNGLAWRPADAAALTDGSIQIAALATNPLARANHTGTQLASTISDLVATVKAVTFSSFATATANIAMGGYTFTGLPTPTAAGQAAEYAWVLSQIQVAAAGIASKPPVAAVATSNITLSGTSNAIDGYTPSVGDRILVVGQTDATQNGVYNVVAGAWTRTTIDGPAPGELETGALWMIQNGGTYAGSQFRLSTKGAIAIGTTQISIVQFTGASQLTNGAGIALTGNVFSVQTPAGSGILVSAAGVSIDTTIVARKVTATLTGNGANTSFPITHNLGIQNVLVQVFDSSGNMVIPDVVQTSTSVVTVNFGQAVAQGTTYSVTVVG